MRAFLFAAAMAGCVSTASDSNVPTCDGKCDGISSPFHLRVPNAWNRKATPSADPASDRAAGKFRRGALAGETLAGVPIGHDIPIDNVVVIMQENRSFDSYFAHLQQYATNTLGLSNYQVDGAADDTALPAVPGQPVDATKCQGAPPPSDPTALDVYNNTHCYQHAAIPCLAETNHEWQYSRMQFDQGQMDGFFCTNDNWTDDPGESASLLTGDRALAWYDETDIPFYYQLATTFAVGDNYHSALIGPTYPNRDFLYGATSWGTTSNESPIHPPLHTFSDSNDSLIIDELARREEDTDRTRNPEVVTWGIFIDLTKLDPNNAAMYLQSGDDLNAKCTLLEQSGLEEIVHDLRTFAAAAAVKEIAAVLEDTKANASYVADDLDEALLGRIAGAPGIGAAMGEHRKNWFSRRGLRIIEHMHSICDFQKMAELGTLPKVSFVDPKLRGGRRDTDDEHPPGDIQVGMKFVSDVVHTAMKSPQWFHDGRGMAIFLTWDEHGGFYDHAVPPPVVDPDPDANGGQGTMPRTPVADDGGDPTVAAMFADVTQRCKTSDAIVQGDFKRYGFRVPAMVISPFTKPQYVSHDLYDHTSITRFIETRFNLPALTARDANAEPMLDFFDFTNAAFATPPSLPEVVFTTDMMTAFDSCWSLYASAKASQNTF